MSTLNIFKLHNHKLCFQSIEITFDLVALVPNIQFLTNNHWKEDKWSNMQS